MRKPYLVNRRRTLGLTHIWWIRGAGLALIRAGDQGDGGIFDVSEHVPRGFVLDDAIENLRVREDTPNRQNIGLVDLMTGVKGDRAMWRHAGTVGVIETWTRANGYDATIWTALASNFGEPDRAGEPFGVPAAIRYLDQKLTAEQRTVAFAYIRSAPSSVQTPVRDAAAAKWWPHVT